MTAVQAAAARLEEIRVALGEVIASLATAEESAAVEAGERDRRVVEAYRERKRSEREPK